MRISRRSSGRSMNSVSASASSRRVNTPVDNTLRFGQFISSKEIHAVVNTHINIFGIKEVVF